MFSLEYLLAYGLWTSVLFELLGFGCRMVFLFLGCLLIREPLPFLTKKCGAQMPGNHIQ